MIMGRSQIAVSSRSRTALGRQRDDCSDCFEAARGHQLPLATVRFPAVCLQAIKSATSVGSQTMSKRRSNLILASAFFFASAGTGVHAQEPGAPALFRQISVSTGKVIALGEPFNPAGVAQSIGEGVFALRPGKFGGAAKLLIMVSADSRVSEMRFIYGQEVSFDDLVRRYLPRFGQPHSLDGAAPDVGVYWEDGHTRFEILRPPGSETAVSARLFQQ